MDVEQFEQNAEIELTHWWFRGRRQVIERLVSQVVEPGGRILEVGCGTGGNVAKLSETYQCTGIDVSEVAINFARSRFAELDFRLGFAPADVIEESRSADLILIADVLEHVANDFDLLANLIDEAKDGAWILMTVPARMDLWSPHDVSHGHYRRYTPAKLANLWEGLPVEQRLLSHFNTRLFPLIWSVRAITSRIGKSVGKANTDLSVPPQPANSLLTRIFGGEASRLERAYKGEGRGYARGVSLVAMLQVKKELSDTPAHMPTKWEEPGVTSRSNCGIVTAVLPETDRATTVLVPCFNEEKRLPFDAFESALQEHSDLSFVFVDDGSEDFTLARVLEFCRQSPDRLGVFRLPENCGKAEAIRIAMQHFAKRDGKVGFLDADLSTPISEFVRIENKLNSNSELRCVMGSRVRLLGGNIQRSAFRHYFGRAAATAISVVLGLPVYDTQCGAKLFRCGSTASEVFGEPFLSRWIFDVEIIARLRRIARRDGMGVDEIAVELPIETWTEVAGSRVRLRDFFLAGTDLLRIGWRYRRH